MRTLSKSDFKVATDCATKLFYKEERYPSTLGEDEMLALLAEGGFMVEQLAKLRHPAAVELPTTGSVTAAAAQTAAVLAAPRITLHEATLLHGRRMARVDILERDGDRFRLIEVKAKVYDRTMAERETKHGGNGLFWKVRERELMSDWRPYLEDVTYQVLILEALFPDADVEPVLCLLDPAARCTTEGLPTHFTVRRDEATGFLAVDFTGDRALAAQEALLIEVPVREEVDALRAEVAERTAALVALYEPEMQRAAPTLTHRCRDCEYRVEDDRSGFHECWGPLADVTPSILELYQVGRLKDADKRPLVEGMLATGQASLHDVPDAALGDGKIAARQRLQIRHTAARTAHYDERLDVAVARVRYPLHFIDFETARLAIPWHRGMRPYGQVAFQWSCHTQREPGGAFEHREWLFLDPGWPNADFARALRAAVGDDGTILTWAHHEASVLTDVARELATIDEGDADLAAWLADAVRPLDVDGPETWREGRMLDLCKLTKAAFYHPGMKGSNSIKAVLAALWSTDPTLRAQHGELMGREAAADRSPYDALPPAPVSGSIEAIREGTAAMRAYERIQFDAALRDGAAREGWGALLREYCKLDTAAMVLIWEHWRRAVAARR